VAKDKGPDKGPELWAVAGGKGGTGKSFFSSSTALCLAATGKRIIVVDADLGGANIHSFLGLKRPRVTLSDFFEKKVPLTDLQISTGYDNLTLISGDLQSIESDSIKYTQKLKLFRHMRNLDADFVIMDLGAGSHNNTIDSFINADRMLVVTVPAVTALENLYQFIKNVYFRKLKAAFAKKGLKDRVIETWRNRELHGLANLRDLVEHLRESSDAMDDVLRSDVDNFKLQIVVNQAKSSTDIHLGTSIRSVVRKYLGLNAEYTGYIRYDEYILRCLNNGTPFVRTYGYSRSAKEIESLMRNILNDRQVRDVV
jgi:flagellar biosynthesis protein FlhG